MPTKDTPVKMTAPARYLLSALHEWIIDNGMTPHVLVDATVESVKVPAGSVKDGRIVLNISYSAASGLSLPTADSDWLSFSARFNGTSMQIFVPIDAVLAIYARETYRGQHHASNTPTPPPVALTASESATPESKEALNKNITEHSDGDAPPPDDTPPSPPVQRGHLRVVK